MKDDKKKILSNLNKDIEQDKLLQYINRNMTDEEKHAIEQQMAEDEFMNDAVEGLEQLKNPAGINDVVNRLNKNLQEQVRNQKEKRHKRKPAYQSWLYISVILIMLLAVVAYLVIRVMQKS